MRDEVSRTSEASATHGGQDAQGIVITGPCLRANSTSGWGTPGRLAGAHISCPLPQGPHPHRRGSRPVGPPPQQAQVSSQLSALSPGARSRGKEHELTTQRPGPLDPSRNRGSGGSPCWSTSRQAKNCQGESDSGKGCGQKCGRDISKEQQVNREATAWQQVQGNSAVDEN